MEEEKKGAEEIPHEALANSEPNAEIVNRLNNWTKCEAGEAILAIKITCSADYEGTKLGIGVKVIGPDLEKVKSLMGGFLTMAASNVAVAIRNEIRPMMNEHFTKPVLQATEEEFAEAVSKKAPKADKPEVAE